MSESFRIVLGPRLRDWHGVVEGALNSGGAAYKREMQHYPPSQSEYHRTRALGDTARWTVNADPVKLEMELESLSYGKYVIFGTGIYGERKTPIVPVEKKVLAWRGAGGVWHFARSVRGTLWPGKLAALRRATIAGVKAGFRREPR